MSDFALAPTSILGVGSDLLIRDQTWLEVSGLETAVRLSLFLDARAREGDELPDGTSGFGADRRGYWAELYLEDAAPFGSRLWLLKRSPLTQAVRQRARDYCLEALAWLVELGIAKTLEVETEVQSVGRLAIRVTIRRDGDPPDRFAYLWEAN